MRGFVDDEGQTVFLKDLDPANWETKDHGSFVEILLLAPPDGGFGREVMNSYVLHDDVVAAVFDLWNPSAGAPAGSIPNCS
jgi:hypothetical protein